MEPITIRQRENTYTVVTSGGRTVIVRGSLRILGDFVIIGDNIFHRPESVE